MIRRLALAVEDWMDDESFLLGPFKFCVVVVGGLAALVFLIARLFGGADAPTEMDLVRACADQGLAWVRTGEHWEPGPSVLVGKVVVPGSSRRVVDYGCRPMPRGTP